MTARVTLKAVSDELAKSGHHARLEKASGYFYFWTEDAGGLDRPQRADGEDQRAHAVSMGPGVAAELAVDGS
jgi:hypothetical protein